MIQDNTTPEENIQEDMQSSRADEGDYKEKWMRAQADYQNLHKTVAHQRSEWAKQSEALVLQDFLPILGNFKKAFDVDVGDTPEQFENWRQGIAHIKKQFEDSVEKKGVTVIPTVGETFDPFLHEAVSEEKESDHASGTIVQEVEPGYMRGETVLKPARVIVRA
jgi:molecular chaperone GrpE